MLIHLGVGFTTGGLALVNTGVPLLPWLWTLRMAHVHLLRVGWMVQLARGVTFWVFPRYDATGDRGNERPPIWVGYIVLNSGAFLAAIQAPTTAHFMQH